MLKSTAQIWEDFHRQLRAFILARVSDPADADDILQDVFLKIHTRIETLRDQDRLAGWLYQIARHAIIDFYRARQPVDELPETLAVVDEPAESSAVDSISDYLKILVDDLPEKYREAVLLTEYDGLTQEEMGTRLGLSASGAKSRIQRSRALLREELLDCCHFEFDRVGNLLDYAPNPKCCEECAAQV